MKTHTITTYSFNELNEKAQAVAIESMRNSLAQDESFNAQDIIDEFSNKLADYGFISPSINYTGFGSQGDGASFDCKSIDLDQFTTMQNTKGKYQDLLTLLASNGQLDNIIYLQCVNSHYFHQNTVASESSLIDFNDNTPHEEQDRLGAMLDNLLEDVEDKRLLLCQELYKSLEAENDYRLGDENVIYLIEANEMEYTADGQEFNT